MTARFFKRNEQIKRLSREHHFSLLFCWKIRKGLKNEVPDCRICQYVQYFWKQNLQPHFREEEKFHFFSLKDRQVQRAINEHKLIKQEIEGLTNHSGRNLRKRLAALADMVDDHVRYEERILFPHLQRRLSREQFEIIGRQIEEQNRSCPKDQFEDQFWNIR